MQPAALYSMLKDCLGRNKRPLLVIISQQETILYTFKHHTFIHRYNNANCIQWLYFKLLPLFSQLHIHNLHNKVSAKDLAGNEKFIEGTPCTFWPKEKKMSCHFNELYTAHTVSLSGWYKRHHLFLICKGFAQCFLYNYLFMLTI